LSLPPSIIPAIYYQESPPVRFFSPELNPFDLTMSNMFTNRRPEETGRRPSADFVARFKEQHFSSPESKLAVAHEETKKESNENEDVHITNLTPSMYLASPTESDGTRYDMDPTPKATGAPFRFTPSLLDPNSSAFAAFAAQPPGYYTPTPGGSTMGFQSYELAVNNNQFGTNTPDSMTHASHSSMAAPSIFQPHLHSMDHQTYMSFRQHPYTQDPYQHLSVPGSAVGGAASESSSNYSPETQSGTENTDPEFYMASEVHNKFMNATISRNQNIYGQYSRKRCSSNGRFRFATTLHAATAMLRHSSDIPVTYLNKRQAYTVSVIDTSSAVQNKERKHYRTTVRIAFDEEDQRRTAPACWRLWKDGRGTLESGGNPDKLRAIDYEPTETRAANEKKSNTDTIHQVEDSTTSFDRFTVTWSSTSPKPSLYFCVRFLFLSTDFSHSKGVKGVPVRLVAKTEFLGIEESTFQNTVASELAYCKIKLFRDKGAERKLANDRQHLERAVEKLRQQAQQLTMGTESPQQQSTKKKKRHSFSGTSATESQSTSPQRHHRRDWSISSAASNASNNGTPRSTQDEIQRKLDKAMAMEAMFASIHPASAFSLIGDPADDPSMTFSPIAPQSQWEAPGMGVAYSGDIEKLPAQRSSPALSQTSFSSISSEKLPYAGTSPLVHPLSPPDATARMAGMSGPQPSQKMHVQAATKDIEAMDVDPFYIPMAAPTIRPALCVYITPAKIGPNGDPHTMHLPTAIDPSNDIYYAVYVPARTANALTMAIATKMGLDPSSVLRTTIINKRGLRLALDDEVAREMLEKQDMRVAVREFQLNVDSPQQHNMSVDKRPGLELFLAF
jgi:hypothetical protein